MTDTSFPDRWTARAAAACVRVVRIPLVVDVLVLAGSLADTVSNARYASPHDMVLAAVAVAALLLRRRWPLATWLLTLPAAFVGIAVVPSVLALYALAGRTERRWVLACAGAVMFVVFGAFLTSPLELGDVLLETVYGSFFAVGPIALGLLVRTRAELSARLRDLDRAREQEREQAAAAAVSRERAVLAREMHDVVSHQVSLMAVQAGALQVSARDAETREFARTIRASCVATLQELREMVGLLRAAGGAATTICPQPVLGDLPELVAASGLAVRTDVDLPDDLPPPVQRAVFRFVQEALTNVRKHASGADVVVRAGRVRHDVVVEVRNGPAPGRRVTLPGSGVGIVGLCERAELLGGEVTVRDDAAAGFVLTMRVPARTGADRSCPGPPPGCGPDAGPRDVRQR